MGKYLFAQHLTQRILIPAPRRCHSNTEERIPSFLSGVGRRNEGQVDAEACGQAGKQSAKACEEGI